MCWLQQNLPDAATYNESLTCRLSGAVDAGKIRRALQAMLERHEILRTAFVQREDCLERQIIPARDISLPWSELDFSASPAADLEAILAQQLLTEAGRVFDLTRAPLWRALWIKLSGSEQVLVITFQHSIVDEWSLRLFFQELERLYAFDGRPEHAGLTELPVQYADYVPWQRQRLTGEVLERQSNYWRAQLQDLPTALELPTDRPRPARESGRGATHDFQLTGPVVTKLRDLAREEETTLFTVLLAAFQVWLHRYTGQTDLLVGTPIAHRERPEVQSMLGLFLNTLPIRVKLEENLDFLAAVKKVKESLLGAFSHADLPFERMVEIAVKQRVQGHQPLHQVMFVLLEEGLPALRFDQVETQPMPVATQTSKNDLTLSIEAVGEACRFQFEYATDLFTAETAARMGGHLVELLRSIAAEPEKSIGRLNLMPEMERQQILVEWNKTDLGYPRDKCLHQLIEEQVARTPEAIALIAGTERLTYRALNQRANCLAHRLKGMGVGPEVLVGVCLGRSTEMVVALLAVLKAGGAYVPLDPAYPKERTAFILKDVAVSVLLTEKRLTPELPAARAQVLCLDEFKWKDGGDENIRSGAAPSNLAYIIFTSGSTGQPKGTAIEHRSVVSFVHWARSVFTAEEMAGVLFSTSICFDFSIFDLFVPLVWGGKVILAENALQLPSLPAVDEVTLVNMVPSAMAELLQNSALPPSVCVLNLGGEPLPKSLADKVYASPTLQKLNDGYGPTEATVFTTFANRPRGGITTIGRPIANTQVYIVDDLLQLVPIGVPGELCVAGDGLARGYLNRPELTQEKFIPNPFSSKTGARLYRTGDKARYLAGGNIEYLGRLDGQVKIRGFRVELGEIEVGLSSHPSVLNAVVLACDDKGGNKELAAFVVPQTGDAVTISDLRQYLAEKLPHYLVPTRWNMLDKLPLNPNGKTDRKALAELKPVAPVMIDSEPAAWSKPQRQILEVWEEVLHTKRIGLHDNFFEIGGHSLLATRMLYRLEQKLGRMVSLRAFFAKPTIAQLAEELDVAPACDPKTTTTKLSYAKAPIFIIHTGLNCLKPVLEISSEAEQMPCFLPFDDFAYATVLPGIPQLAKDTLARLREIQPKGPYILIGYCFQGLVTFEMARLLTQAGETVPLVLLIDGAPDDNFYQRGLYLMTQGLGKIFRWSDLQKVACYHGSIDRYYRFMACWLYWKNLFVRLGVWLLLPLVGLMAVMPESKFANGLLRFITNITGKILKWDAAQCAASYDRLKNRAAELRRWLRLTPPLKGEVKDSTRFDKNSSPGNTIAHSASAAAPANLVRIWRDDNYLWMMAGYRPQPYAGKTVLLASTGGPDTPESLVASWHKMGFKLIVELIPGTHESCIAEHSPELARAIQAQLDAL